MPGLVRAVNPPGYRVWPMWLASTGKIPFTRRIWLLAFVPAAASNSDDSGGFGSESVAISSGSLRGRSAASGNEVGRRSLRLKIRVGRRIAWPGGGACR